MPRTAQDVENYLYRLNRSFDIDGETFIVQSSMSSGPPICLRVHEPILLATVDIGAIPADEKKQLSLFRQLLLYNASELIHAAYALDGDEIVLAAGFPIENLDANELAALLNDIDLALTRHIKTLRELAVE